MHPRLFFLFVACLLTVLPADAAPPLYTLTDLGPGIARAIAPDSDMIVGDIGNIAQIFSPTPLSLGVSGLAHAAAGTTLVGELQSAVQRAFRFPLGGSVEPLPLLPGHTHSIATGINIDGVIVGWGEAPPFDSAVGLRWQDGTVTALPRLTPDGECFATGINDVGDIIQGCEAANGSFHAVLLPSTGGLVDLHATALHLAGIPHGINNAQQIVGSGGSPIRGWLREPSGAMLELPPLPGDLWSGAHAINDAGVIVGSSRLPHPLAAEFLHIAAVLWENGVPFDLNPLLTHGAGWALVNALGISQRGSILAVGLLNGQARNALLTPIPPPTMSPLASNSRDLNGDGHADLVWQHSSGLVGVWYLDGTGILDSAIIAQVDDLAWRVIGTGDLDANGQPDIVWRHEPTGTIALWFMDGIALRSTATLPSPRAWLLTAVGDVNGDSHADFLWRHSSTGQVATWLMQGSTVLVGVFLEQVPDLQWRLLGVDDLDGDGQADFVWQHAGTGQVGAWAMDGLVRTGSRALPTAGDPQWHVRAVGDVDGDGHPDLIWRHAATGWVAAWRLDGGSVVGTSWVGQADQGWHLH